VPLCSLGIPEFTATWSYYLLVPLSVHPGPSVIWVFPWWTQLPLIPSSDMGIRSRLPTRDRQLPNEWWKLWEPHKQVRDMQKWLQMLHKNHTGNLKAVTFHNTSVTLLTNLVQLRLSQSHDTKHCPDLNISRYRALPGSRLFSVIDLHFVLTCFPFMFMNNCVSNCLLLFLLYSHISCSISLTLMAMLPSSIKDSTCMFPTCLNIKPSTLYCNPSLYRLLNKSLLTLSTS